jgi:DNA-binding HxlR family transcriptional regulator
MSQSVLSQRLTELKKAGIVAHDDTGDYTLTSEGQELLHALTPLQDWAYSWAIRENAATEKYPDPPSLE